MSRREERSDLELERLFKSMDEVKASDELKASTLAAIFDQMDEEQAVAAASADPSAAGEEATAVRPTLVLVTDDAATDEHGERPERAEDSDKADEGDVKEADSQGSDAKKPARPRHRGFALKVAAALLVVAIGLGGVLSYAIPASHVTVSAGDTTFDLGVNVYGTTVSATANSDAGKAAISSAEIRNVGFEDALGRLIDAYDQQRGGEQDEVQVSVSDPLGGGEKFASDAGRVLEERRPTSPGPAEDPGQGGGAGDSSEPAGVGGPESEAVSPPAQDVGGGVGASPGFAEGNGPVMEGELGGGSEPSGGGGAVPTSGGQESPGGSAPGGGSMEGTLGGMSEQSGMSGQGSASQPGQGQGQGPGGMPR